MREVLRSIVALSVLGLVLSACEQSATTGASSGETRVRLDSKNAHAEIGDHVVHISAMLSSDLTPQIASNYGIVRSQNQGLVNLVVLKKATDTEPEMPIKASVSLSAANLTGQLKNTVVQEIVDGPSIYYISQVSVDDREMLNFDFDVRPEGSNRELLVRFSHQFYTR